jgi:hypothetical protein
LRISHIYLGISDLSGHVINALALAILTDAAATWEARLTSASSVAKKDGLFAA